jgi:GNAT superfamily N-acetyltransferase
MKQQKQKVAVDSTFNSALDSTIGELKTNRCYSPSSIVNEQQKIRYAIPIQLKTPRAGRTADAQIPAAPCLSEDALNQLPLLLDPLRKYTKPKITPSFRLLSAYREWAGGKEGQPVSIRGWMTHAYNYKMFGKSFSGGEHAAIIVRASTATTVELMSIIAYPDSRGHGTVMMDQLCRMADEFGVDIWLDALPYGKKRVHIPLKILKRFYRRFGFAAIDRVRPEWLCGYHECDKAGLANVMFRRASLSGAPATPSNLPASKATGLDGGAAEQLK